MDVILCDVLFLVRQLHRDHGKEESSVIKGNRVRSVCSHGDSSTVQGHLRA